MDTTIKHRMTRQRRIILEELQKVTSHPTADELYDMVKDRLPNISLGTVYRNLELLTTEGRVRVLEGGGTKRRYDGDMQKHYHVRCTNCGKVGDIMSTVEPDFRGLLESNPGFRITGYSLDFYGICEECQKSN